MVIFEPEINDVKECFRVDGYHAAGPDFQFEGIEARVGEFVRPSQSIGPELSLLYHEGEEVVGFRCVRSGLV